MSTSHNDAVLDRVLTRIASAGGQKAQSGRSPTRGISSVLQRDVASVRGGSAADKRRAGSVAKLCANYRLTNPAFGSSSARDSSLAGTNTVVPPFVFTKGILRQPASLALQLPSASAAAAPAPAATAKTSAMILRQQPQRHPSPQPHLRASRCSSPPLNLTNTAASGRRRSSPSDSRSAGGGCSAGLDVRGASPRSGSRAFATCAGGTVSSPRGIPVGRAAAGAMASVGRSRSSPRERPFGGGDTVGGAGGSVTETGGRLAGLHGGEAAAADGAAGGGGGDGSAVLAAAQPRRNSNTITRAAALRALKQQRSTTPDIIEELRAVGAANAAAPSEDPARVGLLSTSFSAGLERGPASAGPSTQQQQPFHPARAGGARAAGKPAPANADAGTMSGLAGPAQPCSSSLIGAPVGRFGASATLGTGMLPSGTLRANDTSPHPPMHPPSQHQQPQARVMNHQQQPQPVHLQPPRLAPRPEDQEGSFLTAGPALAAMDSVGANPWGSSSPRMMVTAGPVQPTSANSAASACQDNGLVWGLGQEPSFRSPSPQRANGPASSRAPPAAAAGGGLPAADATCGAAAVAAAAVAQRQQRAMQQHVQRQNSPSPGRRRAHGAGAGQGAQLRRSGSPQPQQHQRASSPEGGWQGDVVLAAQSRIRRLEEQVISLSAQVAELQASRADLEFQLEEEQQNQHQSRAAGATVRSGGGGRAGPLHAPSHVAGGSPQKLDHQARQNPHRQQQQHQSERERQLQDQVRQLQERLQARDAELDEQVSRSKAVNDTLAKQNRALYGTLEETLSAAEHAAQELKQLRAAHTQLQEAHDAACKEATQLKEDFDLRERALSAVQAEFSALRRRHEDVAAAAEATRRDNALRDGRLRREMETATQEAATLAAQLAKLQREHQQLHSRKAEKDRQLAALAKRADTQQEQLAAAERLAQEQAALVRELESRATLLRNRNAALDRAVAAEKEARQAAQEQVRQMEEEIALLVSIVRQSDPNLEALGRYKRDPAAAAAMAAAAAAAAAAALLQASPSPTHGGRGGGDEDENGGGGLESGANDCTGSGGGGVYVAASQSAPPLPPYSARGGSGGRRQYEPQGHSVVTITAEAGDPDQVMPARGARPTAHPPLSFPIPGAAPLSVRAPPPGSRLQQQPACQQRPDSEDPQAAPPAASAAAILQTSPRGGSVGPSPREEAELGSTRGGVTRRGGGGLSRDNSPLAMPYPAKHNMTGGIFLDVGGGRALSPLAAGKAHFTGAAGNGSSPSRLADDARPAAAGTSYSTGIRSARTPTGRRAHSAGVRRRRGSESATVGFSGGHHLAATWSGGDGAAEIVAAGKAIAAALRGPGGRPEPRRAATPPGTSVVSKGRDSQGQGLLAPPAVATAIAYVVRPASSAAVTVDGISGAVIRRGDAKSAAATATATISAATAAATAKAASRADAADAPPPAGQAAPPLEAVVDLSLGDRVLWAAPRRSNRSPVSGAVAGTRPRAASYAAMHSAQRALATSALTMRDSPAAIGVAAAAAGDRNRSRSCSAVEWVRPRAVQHKALSRRARTPEPRTAAAWLKLTEDPAAPSASGSGGRKRAPTPHYEISSTGRGSYKLGPPALHQSGGAAVLVSEGALHSAGSLPAVRSSDAAEELAALLQQRPPSQRPWAAAIGGGRAAAAHQTIHFLPDSLLASDGAMQREAEGLEEQELEQWLQNLGPLAQAVKGEDRRAGAVEEIAGPSKRSRVGGGSCSGVGRIGDSRDGAIRDLALDDDSKTEMASPIKVPVGPQPHPGGSAVAAPGAGGLGVNSCIGGWDGTTGGNPAGTSSGGNDDGDDDSCSGDGAGDDDCEEHDVEDLAVEECAAVGFTGGGDAGGGGRGSNFCSPCQKDGRGPERSGDRDRPSSIIRASYAFDSPLHRPQQLHEHLQQQNHQHLAIRGRFSPSSSTAPAVVADAGRSVVFGDRDTGVVEADMGDVLRSLKQRQAQLLQQLAGDSNGAFGSSPSAAIGQDAVSPTRLQPSPLSCSEAVKSPGVGSFTFTRLANGVLLGSPARPGAGTGPAASEQLQSDDGGASSSGGVGGGMRRKGQASRGRTVSFADDFPSEELLSGTLPHQLLQLPLPSEQQQQLLSVASLPVQAPPRSPHRPSVAAAAAAAAAAGAGVGGPLTALLDQLESASGSWGGSSSEGAAPLLTPEPLHQNTLPSVPPPSAPPPLPPQQPLQEHHQQLQPEAMTHFSLAAAMQVAAGQVGQPQQLEQPWQQHPHNSQQQNSDSDLLDGGDEDSAGTGDDDEYLAVVGDDVFEVDEGEPPPEDEQSRDAFAAVAASGEVPRARWALADAATTGAKDYQADAAAAAAVEDDINAAAAPQSPQPRDERSAGGSELFPDEVYGADPDGNAGSRLGVTLYDNIAYDSRASEAGSGRADYQPGLGSAAAAATGTRPWRRPSTLGPAICVPTSIAGSPGGGSGDGATAGRMGNSNEQGTHGDPQSEAFSVEPFSPPRSATAPRLLLGDFRTVSSSRQLRNSAPASSTEGATAAITGGSGGLWSATSQAASLETVYRAHRGHADKSLARSLERAVWEHLDPAEEAAVDAVGAVPGEETDQAQNGAPVPAARDLTAEAGADSGETDTLGQTADDLATGPVTPQAAAAAQVAGGVGPSSSSLSLPLSTSSLGGTVASMSAGGAFTRSTVAPPTGSWWLGRAEPTLLDRQQQQQPVLLSTSLSASRASLGQVSYGGSLSSGGASGSGGLSGSSSSVGGGVGGTGSSSHDWLQRRPPSPSVKPLSLAEVLRRPQGSSAR